ncbi:hypothetical protein QAD02_019503 [Eretmocerus hayati]|uniref:Uncharacterized protein n=1 Tax=Eretmocerus hayati TaxID=131215 RepID=A0ACC2PLL0_9HYME|nr:hypothetical protein QAD02_019503 [Eretmocerus hayati]
MRKFRRAQAENQAAIQKHLQENIESSSSDEDNEDVLETAVEKVLSNYQHEGGDVEKTLSYLTDTFQSGGAVCLICISSVKKTDAIWSCSKCFTFLHLPCIQHWVRDSLSYKNEKGILPTWGCPKCRSEYREDQVPRKYTCFCGKTEDPPYQPWTIPHSCGNICEKFLQPECGHKCTLLCHAGPCPPCPKMVSVTCYCGKEQPCPRRCNAKEWSCRNPCNKKYKTCEHFCSEPCHPGNCPPCSKEVVVPCNCKSESKLRKCNEAVWKCNKICGRAFSCKVHVCEDNCHKPGDCNICPLEKNRTCPCGKKKYAISCRELQAPTCGDTCGKLLDCKAHYCSMRCHTEGCGQCLEVVTKSCRCGSYSKEIACVKEFHCTKKCTQMRLCGRHQCNKKCCDCTLRNNFYVCEKVCDNMLNCRKHKCSAPCHSGPCYPCPRTIVVQCRCGNSKITLPCGVTKKIKPPHCNKKCKIPPICHHPKQDTHKCHQGPCPPCRKVCGLVHKRCGHSCPAICHTKVWTKISANGVKKPVGPWEIQKDRWDYKSFPCPPCEFSVMVTCLGGHETLPWPCHKAIPTSCLRPCGQLLSCTNHTCEKLCHAITEPEDSKTENDEDDDNVCMQCEKPCVIPRPQGCTHNCPKLCHPAPCDPCKHHIKIPCHCGINTLFIRCAELTSANSEKRDHLLKCGNQCPKNYPCGHRCDDNCHAGPCQKSEACNKKVKITCKCKRIKKDTTCLLVRKGKATVQCDDVCQKRKEELDLLKKIESEKKRKQEELKNRKEVEMFEKKFKPRRRGRDRHQNEEQSHDSGNICKYAWLTTILIVSLSAIAALFFQTGYM